MSEIRKTILARILALSELEAYITSRRDATKETHENHAWGQCLVEVQYAKEDENEKLLELATKKAAPSSYKEDLEQYPVYRGNDVATCPRCEDRDMIGGSRVCGNCYAEMRDHWLG